MFTRLNEYAAAINTTTSVLAIILVLGLYNREQTASMTTPWIILILAFPIMGVSLYLLVGLNGAPNKMRARFEEVDSMLLPCLPENADILSDMYEKVPQAAGISTYLAKNALYPVYQNTDVTYYDQASKGLEAQLSDLSKAKKFIFMEYHAIEDKESWHRIQKVLTERVQAGVEVRVFYDDMGSIGFINTDFIKKLEAVGIRCRVFNPFMPGLNMFLNNRDHRKITVIDGKVGFTGGYNLANEYFNLTHPYGQWKDTGIRLEGDAVRSLTVTFLEMWNAVSDRDENDTEFSRFLTDYPYEAQQTGFIQPYADSPLDNEQVGEEVYISMVNKAEKYCWFMTPYLIITDEMAHALTLAAKRGVDVRIITPGIPDKKLIYSVTRSFYHELVKDGVHIYEWTPGFCHAKMSVADDCMATCGTINLDYRSLYHHFENGCFMADCDAVLDIRRDFQETMRECRDVTEKYRTGRSAYLRLGQLLMRLFAGLL
jgi:cardiolipin synthase